MRITNFQVQPDIVGRRIIICWDFDLESSASLADIPPVVLRRKTGDFQFPVPAGTDPFLVYDSENFPPAGAVLTDLPGWGSGDPEARTVITVESVSRMNGGQAAEILRRTTFTTYDLRKRPLRRHIRIHDTGDTIGLAPRVFYYYQLFSPGIPAEANLFHYRGVAAPGEGYGLARTMYEQLPAIYRRHDTITGTPIPGADAVPEAFPNRGQLRRFLDLFGASLDLMRSSAEGLLSVQDTDTTHYRYLTHLAQWIGWEVYRKVSVPSQRLEIKYAPALYKLVGTLPGIKIWVERLTGWKCELKEFIHNVFLTNAPEEKELWEIWEMSHNGTDWEAIQIVFRNDEYGSNTGFAGRPACVVDQNNVIWLFWHSNRFGTRELFFSRSDEIPSAFHPALEGIPVPPGAQQVIDENPAVTLSAGRIWLFWDSDRNGTWDIFARVFENGIGGELVQLTDGKDLNRYPAAVTAGDGTIWIFWQSDRRGKSEIWCCQFDGTATTTPDRLSSAVFRDQFPCAVLDGNGDTWLFYSSDRFDRSNIFARVLHNGVWGNVQQITGGRYWDVSPSAVWHNGTICLFWHSNRSGSWQVWSTVFDGVTWSEPEKTTSGVKPAKEPCVLVNPGGNLQCFFRSRQGVFRTVSRSVDFNDSEMLDTIKTLKDRVHYSYDTGIANESWYAINTVGIFFYPDTADQEVIQQTITRCHQFMEPFRPLPVRLVWILATESFNEVISIAPFIEETVIE